MSEVLPEWDEIGANDSFITADRRITLAIVNAINDPVAYLDHILENGLEEYSLTEVAEEVLKKMVRSKGRPINPAYEEAVLYRVFDHAGIQMRKLAFPKAEDGKIRPARVPTQDPADLVELVHIMFTEAQKHIVEDVDNIFVKIREINTNPDHLAFQTGITALSYLARTGFRQYTNFAHTIRYVHDVMMEYLQQMHIDGIADFHDEEFKVRALIRHAYSTAKNIDNRHGLPRINPEPERDSLRKFLPRTTPMQPPLTVEKDPRNLAKANNPKDMAKAETVDYDDSNPYPNPESLFREKTPASMSEVLTVDTQETLTMRLERIPDAEPERAGPNAETRKLPPLPSPIDPKAETVLQSEPEIDVYAPDRTAPYEYQDKTVDMPLYRAPLKQIPGMKPSPRLWHSQAELLEHYFPFLLREEQLDQPGRPADEIYVPEFVRARKHDNGLECTIRLGKRGEYKVILTDIPRPWENYFRRGSPLTEPKAYVTTHFKREKGVVSASVCIGGLWEQFEFKDPEYEEDPLTLEDI